MDLRRARGTLGGLVLVASLQACGGGGGGSSSPTTPGATPSPTGGGTPSGTVTVTPIVATLDAGNNATTYTVTLSPTDEASKFTWSGATCGTTRQTDSDESSIYAWSHPCGGGDATIRVQVASRGTTIACTYPGVASGTGPACTR